MVLYNILYVKVPPQEQPLTLLYTILTEINLFHIPFIELPCLGHCTEYLPLPPPQTCNTFTVISGRLATQQITCIGWFLPKGDKRIGTLPALADNPHRKQRKVMQIGLRTHKFEFEFEFAWRQVYLLSPSTNYVAPWIAHIAEIFFYLSSSRSKKLLETGKYSIT